jgi:hypothetical protein
MEKKTVPFSEQSLRKLVKMHWSGWLDWIEPRGNAAVGRPDVDFLVGGIITPVELKIGLNKGEVFKIDRIRPDQISWHHRFWSAGGVSFFLIASGINDVWMARRIVEVNKPYYGFDRFGRIDVNNFSEQVTNFVQMNS